MRHLRSVAGQAVHHVADGIFDSFIYCAFCRFCRFIGSQLRLFNHGFRLLLNGFNSGLNHTGFIGEF